LKVNSPIDDMEKMEPDNFYIIPYDKEIEVVDGHIKLRKYKEFGGLPHPNRATVALPLEGKGFNLAQSPSLQGEGRPSLGWGEVNPPNSL
jgi:hypothetical protein